MNAVLGVKQPPGSCVRALLTVFAEGHRHDRRRPQPNQRRERVDAALLRESGRRDGVDDSQVEPARVRQVKRLTREPDRRADVPEAAGDVQLDGGTLRLWHAAPSRCVRARRCYAARSRCGSQVDAPAARTHAGWSRTTRPEATGRSPSTSADCAGWRPTATRSEARLAVTADPDRVLVEVADDNSRHPQAAEPDADALDGRGISMLAMLATSWAYDDPYGKTVWFEVANRLPERPTRPVDATTGAIGEPQAGPLSR
jgi:hypothetical protein